MNVLKFLRDVGDGCLPEDLGNAINQVTAAVMATRRAGAVTVTFAIAPFDDLSNIVATTPKIAVKMPAIQLAASMIRAKENGDQLTLVDITGGNMDAESENELAAPYAKGGLKTTMSRE